MSGAQGNLAQKLDSLLKEGLQVTRALSRVETELRQQLLSMDFQGLAAKVEVRAEVLRQVERLIAQKKELVGGEKLHKLIELLPKGTGQYRLKDRCAQLSEKLSAVKVEQRVNRHLAEGGLQLVDEMKNLLSAGKSTYNCCGKVHHSAGSLQFGLDHNC